MSFSLLAGNGLNQERRLAAMRTIGHEVLLDVGDKDSRVLPVRKTVDGYSIQLAQPWTFQADPVIAIVDSIVTQLDSTLAFSVAIEHDASCEIVHNFTAGGNFGGEFLACSGRLYDKDFYTIHVTLYDPSELVTPDSFRLASSPGAMIILILLSIMGVVYFVKSKWTNSTDPQMTPIGGYLFDQNRMRLSYGEQNIDLSYKETHLLALLHASANETLSRDQIQKVVWDDEGHYVGRTLDVFISKLRKKLALDPNVRIVNIRGVGYRLLLEE